MGHLFHAYAVHAPPFSLEALGSSLIHFWLTNSDKVSSNQSFSTARDALIFFKGPRNSINNKTHLSTFAVSESHKQQTQSSAPDVNRRRS